MHERDPREARRRLKQHVDTLESICEAANTDAASIDECRVLGELAAIGSLGVDSKLLDRVPSVMEVLARLRGLGKGTQIAKSAKKLRRDLELMKDNEAQQQEED